MSTGTKTAKLKSNQRAIPGNRVISIEPFKRNQYDRGYKAVYVNGVHWGYIETKWHGCHGTTFHLSDLHGDVLRPSTDTPRPGRDVRMVQVQARCSSAKQWRRDNIGKPQHEWTKKPSSDGILLDMVAAAIAADQLRAPDTRQAELDQAHRDREQSTQAFYDAQQKELADKAQEILDTAIFTEPTRGRATFNIEELKTAIVDAMKWAQTK